MQYIKAFNLPVAEVYGDIVSTCENKLCTTGCSRTGCVWCAYGSHMEKGEDRRFLRLKQTHPQMYDYCMRGGDWFDNPDYVPDLPEYDGAWKNWNPAKIWMPSGGLGYAKIIDMINETYGYEMIAY